MAPELSTYAYSPYQMSRYRRARQSCTFPLEIHQEVLTKVLIYFLFSVLYANTKAGSLLSKSDPETFKAMPNWCTSFSGFLDKLPNSVRVTPIGNIIIMMTTVAC